MAIGGSSTTRLFALSSPSSNSLFSWWDGSHWSRIDTNGSPLEGSTLRLLVNLDENEMIWAGRNASGKPTLVRATR